jgi:hypothetical protein
MKKEKNKRGHKWGKTRKSYIEARELIRSSGLGG